MAKKKGKAKKINLLKRGFLIIKNKTTLNKKYSMRVKRLSRINILLSPLAPFDEKNVIK